MTPRSCLFRGSETFCRIGRVEGLPFAIPYWLDHWLLDRLPARGAGLRCPRSLPMESRRRHRNTARNSAPGFRRVGAAPKSANNCRYGAPPWCPCSRRLSRAGVSTAIMLSALSLWGVKPGPLMSRIRPDLCCVLVAIMYTASGAADPQSADGARLLRSCGWPGGPFSLFRLSGIFDRWCLWGLGTDILPWLAGRVGGLLGYGHGKY